MNLFDSFNNDAFRLASDVFGEVPFVIRGATYYGIINEHSSTKEQDISGISYNIDATIVANKDQFFDQNEKQYVGKPLTTNGRAYMIETVAIDSVTMTFSLSTASNKR